MKSFVAKISYTIKNILSSTAALFTSPQKGSVQHRREEYRILNKKQTPLTVHRCLKNFNILRFIHQYAGFQKKQVHTSRAYSTICHFPIVVILLCLTTFNIKAEGEKYTTKAQNTALTVNRSFALKDGWYEHMQTNANWETNDFVIANLVDYVSIKIDPNHKEEVTGYNDITFALEITAWDKAGVQSTISNVNLVINPNSHTGGQKKQLHLYRFTDAHKFSVKVLSVTDANGAVAPPANVSMELGMEIDRYYYFDHTTTISKSGHYLLDLDADPQIISNTSQSGLYTQADEMEIYWDKIAGAETYELEWTYINDYNESSGNYLPTASIPFSNEDFNANATRISTPHLSYRVPLVFDRGYLIYRVRGIGRLPQGKNYQSEADLSLAIQGTWSSAGVDLISNSTVADFGANYQRLAGHQLSKNWQISTSFAEDGKKKEVISYFDGTLRNRQSVTRANTLNKAIVGETFYDHQGRPAVQALPVPAQEELTYYEDFNQNISGIAYSKEDFDKDDTDPDGCAQEASAMGENSGAGNYYSPNNPDQENQQAYLPDANGYVFTQTEYVADNTGRIKRQSGVGETHRLGGGHETKYFYGTPDQAELDQLFGNDVGHANHYKKTVVLDPNKQASVTYTDLRGNTIATGLLGDSPSNMEAIPNGPTFGSTTIDMLGKDAASDVDDLQDKNHINANEDGLDMNYTLLLPQEDNFLATYTLNTLPAFIESNCSINYQPVVDVKIKILAEECQDVIYENTSSFGTYSATGDVTNQTLSTGTVQQLSAGSYRVEKSLTVDDATLEAYAEDYIEDASCLTPYSTFLSDAWTNFDTTDCFTADGNGFFDCQACINKLGDETFFTDNIGTQTEWDQLVEDCLSPCTYVSSCDAIYATLLADVSPGGQYASYFLDNNGKLIATDPLSVLNTNTSSANLLPAFNGTPNWRSVTQGDYKDLDGNISLIVVNNSLPANTAGVVNGTIYPEQLASLSDFILYWQTSWAEALVQFHPEHEYYSSHCGLITDRTNYGGGGLIGEEYDWVLMLYQTHLEAQNLQYDSRPSTPINAVNYTSHGNYPILNNDPVFTSGGPFTSLYATLKSELDNIHGTGYNLYEFAAHMQKCARWFGSDQTNCSSSYASLTTAQQDEAWQTIRSIYLSLKQEILWQDATARAINMGGSYGSKYYFNGAIGQAAFDYTDYLNQRHIGLGISSSAASIQSNLALQSISGNYASLYAGKEKRFVYFDTYLNDPGQDLGASKAGQKLYERTGLCPEAFALKAFLNDLLTKGTATQNTNLIDVQAFSVDLYQHFTGFTDFTAQPYAEFQWKPSLNSTNLTADLLIVNNPLNTTATTKNQAFQLNFDPSSPYQWSGLGTSFEIEGVVQLIPNAALNTNGSGNNINYGFTIELKLKDPSTGTALNNEVITGTVLNFNPASCNSSSFSGTAHQNQLAQDLQFIFNQLIAHSGGNKFTSTTATDLEVAPFDVPFSTSMESVIDPNQSATNNFAWQATADNKVYEVRASGHNEFLRVSFCTAPTGTNFTSTNTFNDVTYFRNFSPIGANDIPSCTSIGGQSPNFKIEAVHTNYGTTPFTQEIVTLYGLVAHYQDETSTEYWAGNLNTGHYSSFNQEEEDCETLGQSRKGLFALFEATAANQNTGGSFQHESEVYNIPLRSGTLYDELYNQLAGKEVAFSWAPTPWATANGGISYLAAEVPTNPDNYIGLFYINHGSTPINHFDIAEDANGNFSFDMDAANQTENGEAYGYFSCEIHMAFNNQNEGLRFRDIDQYLSVTEKPGSGSNGSTNEFELLVIMANGNLEIISGESCFLLANCFSCETQTPAIPENCWKNAVAYNNLAATITGAPTYTTDEFCALADNQQLTDYSDYINTMGVSSTTSPYYVSYTDFGTYGMGFYLTNYYNYLIGVTSATQKSGIEAALPSSNPPFVDLLDFTTSEVSATCVSVYTTYFGNHGYSTDILTFATFFEPQYPCPLFDFYIPEAIEIEQNPCVELYTNLAIQTAQTEYENYINAVKADFKRRYIEHVLSNTVENFDYTTAKGFGDYHFTLYYYDQVGNLVKTVPPAGVDQTYDPSSPVNPAHTLATNYRYNTLNQLVSQTTPDGGTTQFWYDQLGRLVASQNAKQAANNQYSYTQYDALGRIKEVGQLTSLSTPTGTLLNDAAYPSNWETTREQVNRTYYDVVELKDAETYYAFTQQNLRNRISATAYYATLDDTQSGYQNLYDHATHYSYDEHGNVKTLIQDNPSRFKGSALDKLRFKRISYTYDLISGNVEEVSYQAGEYDQLLHRYEYDADNRITLVYTSKDGLLWDRDASYDYYHHGPLARTEIGNTQVQGMDYAYTLQGWLKTMNASTLNKNRDLGKDGAPGQHAHFSKDAYAFSLHYFHNDYQSINAAATPITQAPVIQAPEPAEGPNMNALYNGNIALMVNSIWDNTETTMRTQANRYGYDQLNRLVDVDVYHDYDGTTDGIQTLNTLDNVLSTTDYQSDYTYDGNGNLLTLKRNGSNASLNSEMDNLVYEYYPNTNRLRKVSDNASVTDPVGDPFDYADDLETQTNPDNYVYDAIGNLVKDVSENISEIRWRVDGKISEIIRGNSNNAPNLAFEYDAMGNRIAKIVKPQTVGTESGEQDWTITHYVRDASGNVMAIYTENYEACSSCQESTSDYVASVSLSEQSLYGSDRLGNWTDGRAQTFEYNSTGSGNSTVLVEPTEFTDVTVATDYYEKESGQKVFELKNHLGNVYNTVADYKIWKTQTEEETLFYHNFTDATEVNQWTTTAGATTTQLNEELSVSYTDTDQGISKTTEVNSSCNYTLTLTLKSQVGEPAEPPVLKVTDQNNNTVLTDNLTSVANYTYSITNLSTFGSNMLNVSITSTGASGSFTLDGMSLSSSCSNKALTADVLNANDYYAFGMVMPGRSFNSGDYRYGFNGMEKDEKLKGNGNSYTTFFRQYDPRMGRWLSHEPKPVAWESPYAAFRNNPLLFNDPQGDCPDGDCQTVKGMNGENYSIPKTAKVTSEINGKVWAFKHVGKEYYYDAKTDGYSTLIDGETYDGAPNSSGAGSWKYTVGNPSKMFSHYISQIETDNGIRPQMRFVAKNGKTFSDKDGWGIYESPENLAFNIGQDFDGLRSGMYNQYSNKYMGKTWADPTPYLKEGLFTVATGLGVGLAFRGLALYATSLTARSAFQFTKYGTYAGKTTEYYQLARAPANGYVFANKIRNAGSLLPKTHPLTQFAQRGGIEFLQSTTTAQELMFITNASALEKIGSLGTMGGFIFWETVGDKNKNNVTDAVEPKE